MTKITLYNFAKILVNLLTFRKNIIIIITESKQNNIISIYFVIYLNENRQKTLCFLLFLLDNVSFLKINQRKIYKRSNNDGKNYRKSRKEFERL